MEVNLKGSFAVYVSVVDIPTLADPGGATEAMASPKRQTREAKLCFGLPLTGQWVYLVSTESTDFTGFVT